MSSAVICRTDGLRDVGTPRKRALFAMLKAFLRVCREEVGEYGGLYS